MIATRSRTSIRPIICHGANIVRPVLYHEPRGTGRRRIVRLSKTICRLTGTCAASLAIVLWAAQQPPLLLLSS